MNNNNYNPGNDNRLDPEDVPDGIAIATVIEQPFDGPDAGTQHEEDLISYADGQFAVVSRDIDYQASAVKGTLCLPADASGAIAWLLNNPQSSNVIGRTSEGTAFLTDSPWADEYRRSNEPNSCPDGTVRLTANIDKDLFDLLDGQAARWNLTHAQTIRRIINETIEQRGTTTRTEAHDSAGHRSGPATHDTSRRPIEPFEDAVPLAYYYAEDMPTQYATWHDETLLAKDGRYMLEIGRGVKGALVTPDNWEYTELTEREAFNWMIHQKPLRSETTWSAMAMGLIRYAGLDEVLGHSTNPLDPDTQIIRRNVFLDMNTELPKFDHYAFQRNLSMGTALSTILAEALM